MGEQSVLASGVERRPVAGGQGMASILRAYANAAIAGGGDHAGGAQADRDVDGLCAWVEQIERPDIERATAEVEPGWG